MDRVLLSIKGMNWVDTPRDESGEVTRPGERSGLHGKHLMPRVSSRREAEDLVINAASGDAETGQGPRFCLPELQAAPVLLLLLQLGFSQHSDKLGEPASHFQRRSNKRGKSTSE